VARLSSQAHVALHGVVSAHEKSLESWRSIGCGYVKNQRVRCDTKGGNHIYRW